MDMTSTLHRMAPMMNQSKALLVTMLKRNSATGFVGTTQKGHREQALEPGSEHD